MNDCVFCEIVAGRASAYRVLEDEHAVALFHVHVVPRWRGDGARLSWRSRRASAGELEETRARVIAAR